MDPQNLHVDPICKIFSRRSNLQKFFTQIQFSKVFHVDPIFNKISRGSNFQKLHVDPILKKF